MTSFGAILLCALIVSLIKVAGFSVVAEKVHWLFQKIFGRSAYAAYIRDWKDLRKAKQELSTVSAQDEFAKWARLQRNVDKMQADFDKLHSSRKRRAMTIEFGLSIAIRVILYVVLFWYGIWRGRLVAVENFFVPSEFFGPLTGYFAMPYLQSGEASVSVVLILSIVSCKYLMEAISGTC